MLLSGKKSVSVGDSIRLRILYEEDGSVRADRPFRDQPLRINLPNTTLTSITDQKGTYEIIGIVEKMIYANHQKEDYLFFQPDFEVDYVSNSFVQIEVPEKSEEIASHDYTHTDVDFDVESLSDVVITESQSIEYSKPEH